MSGEGGGVWVGDDPIRDTQQGNGFTWGCEVCGWRGFGLSTHAMAMREALRHIDTQCPGRTS